MIELTVKGFAKYLSASPAQQLKILRDYKYPNPEGFAQAGYYLEAIRTVIRFHKNGNDPRILQAASDGLIAQLAGATPSQATKLRNNARGIDQYATNFSTKPWTPVAAPKLPPFVSGNVLVKLTPDLMVKEGKKERLIKLAFDANEPPGVHVRVISQLLYQAATTATLCLPASSVLFVDVPRGNIHASARLGARTLGDIQAACTTISAVWPGL